MGQALLLIIKQVLLLITLIGYFIGFCVAFFVSLFILAMAFFHYDNFRLRQKRKQEVLALAEYVFEDKEAAKEWMRSRPLALGGKRPIDMLDSDKNAEELKTILRRIEYGVYS